MTSYIVCDRRSDPKFPAYLVEGPYTDLNSMTHQVDWYWVGTSRKATRFDGRRSAEVFADRVESWIQTHTGKTVRLSIVPASGGMEITRRSAKTIGESV